MKILGLTYHDGVRRTYMKPDSALLVNEKPFFLPMFSSEIVFRPCLVVRVNRLGRNVEERFASRYYDAWTVGMNMQDESWKVRRLEGLKADMSDVEWIGFDNSLPTGRFMEAPLPSPPQGGNCHSDVECGVVLLQNEKSICELQMADLLTSVDAAIAELTRYVTIRMGDFVAVDFAGEQIAAVPEDKWQVQVGGETILTCKIK